MYLETRTVLSLAHNHHTLLAAAAMLLVIVLLPSIKSKREEAFVEE
jgi:hypothetical protein